jgi:hypothetical protein
VHEQMTRMRSLLQVSIRHQHSIDTCKPMRKVVSHQISRIRSVNLGNTYHPINDERILLCFDRSSAVQRIELTTPVSLPNGATVWTHLLRRRVARVRCGTLVRGALCGNIYENKIRNVAKGRCFSKRSTATAQLAQPSGQHMAL